MNRIEKKFQQLKKNKRKAFIAYITAGYPNISVTERLIKEFDRLGVDILELGVPFSDPMADGPVIQDASKAALDKGINLEKIFNMVKRSRASCNIPICLMTYYNPVFCYGEAKFCQKSKSSGVDGVIIPDLPPEEAAGFRKSAAQNNLDTIFLLSPTSSPARIKMISAASKGFIYYVSLTGVTGARKTLPPDICRQVKAIKRYTGKPVCVGFGVSQGLQVKEINRFADGVIVGSAIVKKIKENINQPDLIRKVGSFVAGLKG